MSFDPSPPPPPRFPWGPRPQARTALAGGLVLLLGAALGAAFATGNRDLATTLAVGVLSAVSTIVGFFFGSSKGSQGKDATIAVLSHRGCER